MRVPPFLSIIGIIGSDHFRPAGIPGQCGGSLQMQGRGFGAETPGPPVLERNRNTLLRIPPFPLARYFPDLAETMRLHDKHGRAITDLRVSITDRCNYKCVYCRTGNEAAQYSELPIADYLPLVGGFVGLGIEK